LALSLKYEIKMCVKIIVTVEFNFQRNVTSKIRRFCALELQMERHYSFATGSIKSVLGNIF